MKQKFTHSLTNSLTHSHLAKIDTTGTPRSVEIWKFIQSFLDVSLFKKQEQNVAWVAATNLNKPSTNLNKMKSRARMQEAMKIQNALESKEWHGFEMNFNKSSK